MKPVIGISGNYQGENNSFWFKDFYVNSILEAGGVPVLLPSVTDEELLEDYFRVCQGFVLSGGGDLDPVYWGEFPDPGCGEIDPLRDRFEVSLVRRAYLQNKAVLGICRGCQVLNAALGGTIWQDIKSPMAHSQKAPRNHLFHDIFIEKGSNLENIVGDQHIRVNSFHHQAVKLPGNGLYISAMAPDGIAEAVESRESLFFIGVQWHPECLKDDYSARLFSALTAAALGKLSD